MSLLSSEEDQIPGKGPRSNRLSQQIYCPKGADNSIPSSPFADHTDSRTPFGMVFVCTTRVLCHSKELRIKNGNASDWRETLTRCCASSLSTLGLSTHNRYNVEVSLGKRIRRSWRNIAVRSIRERLSIVKSFWDQFGEGRKNTEKGGEAMVATEHKTVVHAARLRGRIKTYQVKSEKSPHLFALHAKAASRPMRGGALSSSACMVLLCQFKGGRLITLSMQPDGKDDPDPHVGQRSYCHGMAFTFCSLSLVVVSGPCFTLGRLPSKGMQRITQRFDTAQPAMRFGVHPTLKEHRRSSSQRLQTAGILITSAIITDFCQESRSQALASPGQAFKDLMVLMGQKKGVNLLVILSNLLNQRQQLTHQHQHQTRLGADRHAIGLQCRLMHLLHNRNSRSLCLGMPAGSQQFLDLLHRGGLCSLWGWIRLQEEQRALLLQFPKEIQCHGIIRFEASGELIHQAGLQVDQALLITRQLLEFRHLLAVWGETMQIGKVGSSGLRQQVSINGIRLGSRCCSSAIDGARVDRVDGPSCLQQRRNQQTMSRLNDAGHLLLGVRADDLFQKGVQGGKSFGSVIHPQRSHPPTLLIQRQSVVMLVRPVNTGIPHETCSSLSDRFLSTRALILWRSKRDSLMIASAQEWKKAKCELSQSVEPGGGSRLSPSGFNRFLEQVYSCSGPVSRGLVLSLMYKEEYAHDICHARITRNFTSLMS